MVGGIREEPVTRLSTKKGFLAAFSLFYSQEDDGSVRRGREPPCLRADAARAADREGRPGPPESAGRGETFTSTGATSGLDRHTCSKVCRGSRKYAKVIGYLRDASGQFPVQPRLLPPTDVSLRLL